MQFEKVLFLRLVADILSNLSAGWFATALIIPILSAPIDFYERLFGLTGGILNGIVYLLLSYFIHLHLKYYD